MPATSPSLPTPLPSRACHDDKSGCSFLVAPSKISHSYLVQIEPKKRPHPNRPKANAGGSREKTRPNGPPGDAPPPPPPVKSFLLL
jgi:hypothetical protein